MADKFIGYYLRSCAKAIQWTWHTLNSTFPYIAWKTDKGSPVSPGQCSCRQVCSCNGYCAWLWLWAGWSSSIFSWFGMHYLTIFCSPTKPHLAGKQYRTDDEVINYLQLRTFSRIRMRASLYHGNPSAATPMEEVCGPQRRIMLTTRPHLVKFDHCIIVRSPL